MQAALRSLSDNSNSFVISVLATNDFLFYSISNFLVLGVMSDFLLEPGHYIVRLQILFKPSDSCGFL